MQEERGQLLRLPYLSLHECRKCGFGCGHIDVRAVSAWPVRKRLQAQNEASKKNRRTEKSRGQLRHVNK